MVKSFTLMDLFVCCDFIDGNIGKNIRMKIIRMGSEKIEQVKGIIKTAFSNEITPVCLIETTTEKTEEIFLGEVIEAEILP